MKYFYTFLASLLLFSQLSYSQKIIKLFNGDNLDGWYAFEPKTGRQNNASDLFSVEDNMIRLYGKKLGYLMSKATFQDFKLSAEFRWNMDATYMGKSKKKNSGLMYLVPENTPDQLWPQGIQFQIKEGATGDFILLNNATLEIKGERTTAGKSMVYQRTKDTSLPIGDWNKITITCNKGKITQKLNGKVLNKGKSPSIKEGRILLQYEGAPIDFRKVEIKVL
ncbi:3-keto-disaccharide hydrolase [Saccharicrinis aurantiacus]|uniref:3-keto-disaccharide hydrolase n=1 Tax=Saccharicrinis aurantiacus TaxID=1849719 RepID=UPI0024910D9B|nr:DUF1080 domain-containing protein [Saccharicrinis aurantiacus]